METLLSIASLKINERKGHIQYKDFESDQISFKKLRFVMGLAEMGLLLCFVLWATTIMVTLQCFGYC